MHRFWKGASAVLGLLSGCGVYGVAEYGAPVPEYGVWDTAPRGWVDGVTVDAGTDEVVPHIQLHLMGETTRSDALGYFWFEPQGECGDPCLLEAEDVDGPANGSYQDATVELDSGYASDVKVQLEPVE